MCKYWGVLCSHYKLLCLCLKLHHPLYILHKWEFYSTSYLFIRNLQLQIEKGSSWNRTWKSTYLHIWLQRWCTKTEAPKYDARNIRDVCVEPLHCLVSPAVQHLSWSNCYKWSLKVEKKGLSECKQTLFHCRTTEQNHRQQCFDKYVMSVRTLLRWFTIR